MHTHVCASITTATPKGLILLNTVFIWSVKLLYLHSSSKYLQFLNFAESYNLAIWNICNMRFTEKATYDAHT
jgi:hypothetical protein